MSLELNMEALENLQNLIKYAVKCDVLKLKCPTCDSCKGVEMEEVSGDKIKQEVCALDGLDVNVPFIPEEPLEGMAETDELQILPPAVDTVAYSDSELHVKSVNEPLDLLPTEMLEEFEQKLDNENVEKEKRKELSKIKFDKWYKEQLEKAYDNRNALGDEMEVPNRF